MSSKLDYKRKSLNHNTESIIKGFIIAFIIIFFISAFIKYFI
jgi:hypothetical protein